MGMRSPCLWKGTPAAPDRPVNVYVKRPEKGPEGPDRNHTAHAAPFQSPWQSHGHRGRAALAIDELLVGGQQVYVA